jgi:nucleoid-associated protein YgaU|tara:strand:- start:108 stop:461 length:354 start_codon:yes stop_codon:yes gene_type:complete
MATKRYDYNTNIVENDFRGSMSRSLESRGATTAIHFSKQDFNKITEVDRAAFENEAYIYKSGDRLFKIAFDAYGDSRYWYLLAWWNQKPTDFHCKVGDIIYIPRPLKDVLYLWTKER